ncbi:MAG: peptidoglycan DD-metalloendopeptidase family protein [Alphaproteobacteria bacterium]
MRLFAALKSQFAFYRLVPLRRRYLVTRHNKVRLRYMAGSFAALFIALYGVSWASASASSTVLRVAGDFSTAYAEIAPAGGDEAGDYAAEDVRLEAAIQSSVSGGIRRASLAIKKPERPRYRELQVKPGDTVAGLLQEAGLSGAEAYRAVKALEEYYDVRKVKSGQKIDVHFKSGDDGVLEFTKMSMKLDAVKEVSVVRGGPEDFRAELSEKELFPRVYARKAQIETSVYGSAARANIPSAVIAEMIRIYSWNIDFQRDIRSGDKVEVLYEAFETEDGEFAKYGNVLYANLSVGGRNYPIYRFEMDDGRVDFFEPDGISIRKTLMKTPIDGARLSSGFGMRRHPVLGYNKMHKGMDFAASTGTPIYAAGDGVVEHAGRKGGYGNYVRIRHNSKLKTAYAHMHSIKVKNGARVKQGQVIGTVGTTGRSTGPHLHYEVLVYNKQVNPRSIKLPTGEQLAGKELQRFKNVLGRTKQQYVSLSEGLKFASASADEEASSSNIH